ncbi:MAG: hypothetical protein HQK94_08310 [Nitrospirae bacterium]|nr:hypothetical protein [Nitrospirota bacterium]
MELFERHCEFETLRQTQLLSGYLFSGNLTETTPIKKALRCTYLVNLPPHGHEKMGLKKD